MKLTARVKLNPTPEQHDLLVATLECANVACNYISERAFNTKTFKQFNIHKLVYYDVRERFPLSAQMVIRAIGKVADAYKANQEKQCGFGKHGAFPYDRKNLAWKLSEKTVALSTLNGRERIPFVCGKRDWKLLQSQRGETDLCFIRGEFFLFTACDVDTPEPIDVEGFLGVDLGIASIATDSDGENFSGSHVRNSRHRHQRLRRKLQKKGTKSAKRKLKKLSGKEKRFAKDVNHCVSKQLVDKAKRTGRGIALEDLSGIRGRVRVRKSQRRELHSWSFFQLRQYVTYKAELHGVTVQFVDPSYTSQTCPECGHVSKSNRRSQSEFSCVSCGCAGHADHFAAVNISRRAVINRPNVGA